MKRTSIISVNFNQPEVTIDFLKSIKLHANLSALEVIIVDNGSREDHQAGFLAEYPDLIYIRSEQNLGFAGGNNLGIRKASGDYLLLLNNDTEITAGLIETLTAELDNNPEIGLISPLLLYYDAPEVIQYAGFTEMNYLTCRNSVIGGMELNKGQYDGQSRETGFCHGAAMMCRTADLQTVGMMEEQFFLYYEELDWCEKFKRAGKKIWFTGNATVYHKESMSVGKESMIKTYFMTRNRILFIRRNTGLLNTILFCIYYIGLACPKQILIYLKKGRNDLVKWVYRGIGWNFSHSKDSTELGFKI
ncbi:glycosyltransferase family 2 protein [Pedobacter sp. MC2016-15]|uniref:glycosyltransferase family 2 protein n=1 Tax=Pedobacter sp. MC2016-15 TaxID=2994473 RepID=UPI002245E4CB|nr:glycosyltransferase family 2 protein [Pedobacter sp. MC2016-15]MCX2479523.1 glycosyltransferase family 2 protein [Pedobacter sp. MC2016-15]